MYDPNAFIVPGFNPGMPAINKPPIGLTDEEILVRDRVPADPRRHADRDDADDQVLPAAPAEGGDRA